MLWNLWVHIQMFEIIKIKYCIITKVVWIARYENSKYQILKWNDSEIESGNIFKNANDTKIAFQIFWKANLSTIRVTEIKGHKWNTWQNHVLIIVQWMIILHIHLIRHICILRKYTWSLEINNTPQTSSDCNAWNEYSWSHQY